MLRSEASFNRVFRKANLFARRLLTRSFTQCDWLAKELESDNGYIFHEIFFFLATNTITTLRVLSNKANT